MQLKCANVRLRQTVQHLEARGKDLNKGGGIGAGGLGLDRLARAPSVELLCLRKQLSSLQMRCLRRSRALSGVSAAVDAAHVERSLAEDEVATLAQLGTAAVKVERLDAKVQVQDWQLVSDRLGLEEMIMTAFFSKTVSVSVSD